VSEENALAGESTGIDEVPLQGLATLERKVQLALAGARGIRMTAEDMDILAASGAFAVFLEKVTARQREESSRRVAARRAASS